MSWPPASQRLGQLDAVANGDVCDETAYWWTSSTSFANPAVTLGRTFTDTFAGIAPASVPGFVLAQLVSGLLAVAAIVWWYPDAGRVADAVAVPHAEQEAVPR